MRQSLTRRRGVLVVEVLLGILILGGFWAAVSDPTPALIVSLLALAVIFTVNLNSLLKKS